MIDNSNSKNYFDQQEVDLRMLWNFFAIIGDYDSMLLLFPYPPQNCPSMNLKHIIAYYLHKFLCPGEPVTTSIDETGDQIRDVFGTPMYAMGGTQDPKSLEKLKYAVIHLHGKKSKFGDINYAPPCPACSVNFQSWKSLPVADRPIKALPCISCAEQDRCNYVPSGNPFKSDELKHLCKHVKNLASMRGYTIKHATGSFPKTLFTCMTALCIHPCIFMNLGCTLCFLVLSIPLRAVIPTPKSV